MDWKHCEKRRNRSFGANSPFSMVFSKDLYCWHVKTKACLGKAQEDFLKHGEKKRKCHSNIRFKFNSICSTFKSVANRVHKSFYWLFPKQALVFTCLHYKSFENTAGKGEIARDEHFLLFPQCFLTIRITCSHVHQISNCHLQTLSVWKSLKFVVWERVNEASFSTCETRQR